MNNSVYGKTKEDSERRVDIKLVSTWEAPDSTKTGRKAHCTKTLISKSHFHSATKIKDNFYELQMKGLSVLFNKPIYLGFAILDLLKWKLYDFQYQYIKPKFQEKLLFNYMDTDSFIYKKLRIFIKIFVMILKQNLIHWTIQLKELKKKFWVF